MLRISFKNWLYRLMKHECRIDTQQVDYAHFTERYIKSHLMDEKGIEWYAGLFADVCETKGNQPVWDLR